MNFGHELDVGFRLVVPFVEFWQGFDDFPDSWMLKPIVNFPEVCKGQKNPICACSLLYLVYSISAPLKGMWAYNVYWLDQNESGFKSNNTDI